MSNQMFKNNKHPIWTNKINKHYLQCLDLYYPGLTTPPNLKRF